MISFTSCKYFPQGPDIYQIYQIAKPPTAALIKAISRYKRKTRVSSGGGLSSHPPPQRGWTQRQSLQWGFLPVKVLMGGSQVNPGCSEELPVSWLGKARRSTTGTNESVAAAESECINKAAAGITVTAESMTQDGWSFIKSLEHLLLSRSKNRPPMTHTQPKQYNARWKQWVGEHCQLWQTQILISQLKLNISKGPSNKQWKIYLERSTVDCS